MAKDDTPDHGPALHGVGTAAYAAVEAKVQALIDRSRASKSLGAPLSDDVLHEVAWRAVALSAEHLVTETVIERKPPGLTLYLKLGPTGSFEQKTGVFIPDGFTAGAAVNVIVYLHGNWLRVYARTPTSIADVWSANAGHHFLLREGLNESKQNYILVAPTIGAGDEGGGKLVTMFDSLMTKIMEALYVFGPAAKLFASGTIPGVGDVILSGHSGAGGAMIKIASTTKNSVKEIWGFDTLIGGVEGAWRSWAVGHSSNARVFLYYRAYKDASLALARETEGVKSVYVMSGDLVFSLPGPSDKGQNLVTIEAVEHDNLLYRHWLERLQHIGATFWLDEDRRNLAIKVAKDAVKPAPASRSAGRGR